MYFTVGRRLALSAALALLIFPTYCALPAHAAFIIPTNAGGADAEVRESDTAVDFLGTPQGTNRGASVELASRIRDQVDPLAAANPGAVTEWFPTADRSSVAYLKFNISSLPGSADAFWTNHRVRLKLTPAQGGNFNNLFGTNPSNPAETVRLRFRVLGLEPGHVYGDDNPLALNRTDRLGHAYVASQNLYDWSEAGITFYNAPGITPHCMAQGSCLDPNIPNSNANSVVQTLGIHDDFNSDARVLGSFRAPDPIAPPASDLQVGQPIFFQDNGESLEQLILDAKDAGRSSITVMVHIGMDGTVHQPNVGRPGTTPAGMLNRNYLFNPKERLTLLVDPDSPYSGASNATGTFSPQLFFTIPEPTSAILAGLGLLITALIRRRA